MPLTRVTFSGRLGPQNNGESQKSIIFRGLIYMALDIGIALGVSIALFYFFVKTMVAPTLHPFPCNDESIRKPFLPNTVGMKHLLLVSLGSPFVLIAIVEAFVFYNSQGKNRLAKYFTTTTQLYLKYILLFALCTFAMEFLKCHFGRLRPHFVAACKPDWTKMDCSTDPNALIPASETYCTNPDVHRVRTARTSFPSGHTAAAFLVFFFYFIYLRRMANATLQRNIILLKNIILPLITLWTGLTAVTRVTDCWHHPTDVLGGFILALICLVPFYLNSWKSPEQIYESRQIEKERPHFE